MRRLRTRRFPNWLIGTAGLLIAVVLIVLTPVNAAAEPAQGGAALLARIQSGQMACGKLSSGDLTLMGEYDMGRIMGSTATFNAMNAQMLAISGAREERLAYRFMGQRLGGCAAGNGPVSFGTMMGIMGTSMMGASFGSAYPASGYGSAMMGDDGSGGISVTAVIGIAVGLLILLVLIVFVMATTRRRPT